MLDDLFGFLEPPRSSSDREKTIGLAFLAAFFAFLYPFFDCPCGAREPFRLVGTPTEDRAEFVMVSCKACKRSGRLSMFDRCFGDEPLRPDPTRDLRPR
jgi:hypothetical protein